MKPKSSGMPWDLFVNFRSLWENSFHKLESVTEAFRLRSCVLTLTPTPTPPEKSLHPVKIKLSHFSSLSPHSGGALHQKPLPTDTDFSCVWRVLVRAGQKDRLETKPLAILLPTVTKGVSCHHYLRPQCFGLGLLFNPTLSQNLSRDEKYKSKWKRNVPWVCFLFSPCFSLQYLRNTLKF